MKKSYNWQPIAHLMLGLVVLFLFTTLSVMRETPAPEPAPAPEPVALYKNNKELLYTALTNTFSNEIANNTVEITEELTTRFTAPITYFAVNRDTIQPAFTKILNEFVPQYVSLLYKWNAENPDILSEIRVEGHSSSFWNKKTPKDSSYYRNMKLSQGRARNVVQYMMQKYANTDEWEFLKMFMTANGMSSSRIIVNENNEEDTAKSMRVEFNIVLDSKKIVESL